MDLVGDDDDAQRPLGMLVAGEITILFHLDESAWNDVNDEKEASLAWA